MEINTAEIAKQMIREDAVLIESGVFEIDDKKYRIILELKECKGKFGVKK